MLHTKAKGQKFYVYGVHKARPGRRREYVLEEIEWAPDEPNRGGMADIVHLGFASFGVGEFDQSLTVEQLKEIEKKAVWLDGIEVSDIGRWKGNPGREAVALGFEYAVEHPEADEAADPSAEDVDL